MPFYRRLAVSAKRAGVRFVAASGEDLKKNADYLSSNQVSPDAIISAEKNQIPASATPLLILVRGDGRVVNSWTGQLGESQEKEVLHTIEGGSL